MILKVLKSGLLFLMMIPFLQTQQVEAKQQTAIFAGGCFWCMEPPFEKLEGVSEVVSGYTGGPEVNPSYRQVASGKTGHVEAVRVEYDPDKVSYQKLLEVFWKQVDPTDPGGQFVDRGHQYSTAIFYKTQEQKRLAEQSKAALDASGRYTKKIVTPIKPAGPFYDAEDYHQDYYKRSAIRYKFYRYNSGRDQYLSKVWKDEPKEVKKTTVASRYTKPPESELKKKLSPLQYHVTQEEGTERPFNNEYWDNKQEGIYVDIVSGEPLFSSTDKYKSGTGWPSFTKPLVPDNIIEKEDRKLFMVRVEVRSRYANSHLGHVFNDGPKPTGLRYCINSAALRFIPKEELKQQGYDKYLSLFN